MPEVQVYILDDQRQLCRVEQAGDVWVGGPLLFKGYLNDDEKTADRLFVNPFAGYQVGQHSPVLAAGPGCSVLDPGSLAPWVRGSPGPWVAGP